MSKYEELKNKVSEELQDAFVKNMASALNSEAGETDNLPLKLEMASFILRNDKCLSEQMIEKLLEMDNTLEKMVETLHDYVFVDGILMEIFEDAFVNDEENKEYIREMTYGDFDEDEEDEYDDYEDEEETENEEDDNDSDGEGEYVDTIDDLDCEREDLDSYAEYLNEHDEGFIHDNEDC